MESSGREERGCAANTDRGSRSGPGYHSQGRPRGCLMIWQTEQAAVQTLLHRWKKKTGEEGMTEDGSADLSYKNVSSLMPPPLPEISLCSAMVMAGMLAEVDVIVGSALKRDSSI